MFKSCLNTTLPDLAKVIESLELVPQVPKGTAKKMRAKIIAATLLEIAEVGFHGAKVEKIASRAEVSKAVLCYHFQTKDALLATAAKVCTRLFSCGANISIPAEIEQVVVTDYLRAALDGFVSFEWSALERPVRDLVRRIHLSPSIIETSPTEPEGLKQ